MLITSLKEKELYKVRTPIFYDRNAERERDEEKRRQKGKNRRSFNHSWATKKE